VDPNTVSLNQITENLAKAEALFVEIAAIRQQESIGQDVAPDKKQSGEPGREEVVYLLSWKNRETQVIGWKKFLEDPEWIGVKKATSAKWGNLVGDVQDRSLDMMHYTPKPSPVP
jgi:hypothetical protein